LGRLFIRLSAPSGHSHADRIVKIQTVNDVMAERDARLDPGRRTADEFARLGMLQALFPKGNACLSRASDAYGSGSSGTNRED
jgi:hypothetical protein